MGKPRKNTGSRNPEIAAGVNRFGRAAGYHHKGLWNIKNKKATKKAAPTKKAKDAKDAKKDVKKPALPRTYPTEDVRQKKVRHFTPKTAKLRASITPGTVLILLAGRHRGKRVVFLKQLPSGLLLITGPYKVNGVPVRRVNQAYVIATSTKVDVSKVKIDAKFNDAYFKKPVQKKKKTEGEFFATDKEEKKVDPQRAKDQKTVDEALLAEVKKNKTLKAYLGAKFSLTNGMYPHALKF